MRKLSKNLAAILTALLAFSYIAALINPALGSTGNIYINTDTAPSPIITIKLGGSINLYFGSVTWSGGQVRLYLSEDGYASVGTGDTPYGPVFSVADLTNMAIKTVDGYTVGYNWINGTVPESLQVPGGNYYVKAFDGSTAAVAVTDNYFTIEGSFSVSPTWGPGQAPIALIATGLPANAHANFSYRCVTESIPWTTIVDLVLADEFGSITYNMIAPDLLKALSSGQWMETYSLIEFRMIVHETAQTEMANFNEYWRGLIQVKGKTQAMAALGSLFGNLTNMASGMYQVDATVLGELMIAGNYFHPGSLTIMWDGSLTLGETTANATGFFNTTVTIPITSKGPHNITIDDGKMVFIVTVNVVPTLILNPTEGPVTTVVTATGYGFPASDGTKINVTLWWDFTCHCYECSPEPVNLTVVQTNVNGHFITTFVVPYTVGGVHLVYAESDGEYTYAEDWFTVVPTLTATPNVAVNNGTKIVISGTGLASYSMMDEFEGWWYYDLNIDYEKDIEIWADCTGTFTYEIIVSASFEQGTHVVSLYEWVTSGPSAPKNTLLTHVLYTVTSAEEQVIVDKLDVITTMLTDLDDFIRTDSTAINTHLTTIQGDITASKEAVLAAITGMADQLTSIEGYSQNAASKATEAATSAGTAASAATDAKTAAQAAQSASTGISAAVYGAIALSLVAALASIYAVITLQRKVA